MEQILRNAGDEPKPARYWLSRPPRERIAALEELRSQYNAWKYGHVEQDFHRVYRHDLIATKRSAGRLQDLADIENLDRES